MAHRLLSQFSNRASSWKEGGRRSETMEWDDRVRALPRHRPFWPFCSPANPNCGGLTAGMNHSATDTECCGQGDLKTKPATPTAAMFRSKKGHAHNWYRSGHGPETAARPSVLTVDALNVHSPHSREDVKGIKSTFRKWEDRRAWGHAGWKSRQGHEDKWQIKGSVEALFCSPK